MIKWIKFHKSRQKQYVFALSPTLLGYLTNIALVSTNFGSLTVHIYVLPMRQKQTSRIFSCIDHAFQTRKSITDFVSDVDFLLASRNINSIVSNQYVFHIETLNINERAEIRTYLDKFCGSSSLK